MATLKLTLNKRRVKHDNTYPLIFRLSVNGESRDIPTGNSIHENDWNFKTQTLKKTTPAYDLISEKVKTLELKYLNKIWEYEKTRSFHVTAQELKDFLLSKQSPRLTVYQWSDCTQDMVTDSSGNSYVVGNFGGNATFGSFNIGNGSGDNMFLVKQPLKLMLMELLLGTITLLVHLVQVVKIFPLPKS